MGEAMARASVGAFSAGAGLLAGGERRRKNGRPAGVPVLGRSELS